MKSVLAKLPKVNCSPLEPLLTKDTYQLNQNLNLQTLPLGETH